MITMHCVYPDGETSEARYAMTLELAIELYSPWSLGEIVYGR